MSTREDDRPIAPYTGPRTLFFIADVEPKEVMNFGVRHGIPVSRASTVEIFGHLLAAWTVTSEATGFEQLRSRFQDLFDVTLALYALRRLARGDQRSGLPQRVVMHSWLEARGVEARANVLGTIHGRYRPGSIQLVCEDAVDFRAAVLNAWRLMRTPTLASPSRTTDSHCAKEATTRSSMPTGR